MTDTIMDTARAAADMLVAESTIRSWVHNGWLPIAHRGPRRKAYYWRADVLKAEQRARRGEPVADRS